MSAQIIGILFFAIFGAIIVWANIDYYLARAKMTPEQRAEFDEEIRRELQIW